MKKITFIQNDGAYVAGLTYSVTADEAANYIRRGSAVLADDGEESVAGSSVLSTSVSYSATITPAVSADRNELRVGAMTGNVTIAAPTGTARDGQVLTIGLLQDATGGRTVTLDAIYAFGTDVTAAMIPTTANAACEIGFKYHGGSSKWRAVAIARGF